MILKKCFILAFLGFCFKSPIGVWIRAYGENNNNSGTEKYITACESYALCNIVLRRRLPCSEVDSHCGGRISVTQNFSYCGFRFRRSCVVMLLAPVYAQTGIHYADIGFSEFCVVGTIFAGLDTDICRSPELHRNDYSAVQPPLWRRQIRRSTGDCGSVFRPHRRSAF